MPQFGILHTHCGGRATHGGNAIALVHGPLFHAQASAVEVGHGIHLCSAGKEDFLLRTGYIPLHGVQIIHRGRTGENNVALLGHAFIGFIQLEGAATADVNRIPESDALSRGGRERNHITTVTGINTAQAINTIIYLSILVEFNRIIVPDTQVAVCTNRAAIGPGARRRIPAQRHTSIVTQRDGAGKAPINRAAIGGGGGANRRIPAQHHTLIVTQRNIVIPINRAAVGVVGGGASRRIPAERHTSIVTQRDVPPINRAAIAAGGEARRRIPAERHTSIVTQRDGADPGPINRAAVGK